MNHSLAQPATRLLGQWGPVACANMSAMGQPEAASWCAQLTHARSENFSVISSLLAEKSHADFAAVYAFCRWADDLGDEARSPEQALELLSWWRDELRQCYQGVARHPIFVALKPVIARHGLPQLLFDELIQAFEWDNRQTRWESMDELTRYCALSANPVGRLVLAVLGEPCDERQGTLSDCVCTALQLVNHWQDVKRDALERGRVYLPRQEWRDIPDFEERLMITARRGWAADLEFLPAYRAMLERLCDHTERLFDSGEALLDGVSTAHRPVIGLFSAGGRGVLRHIRQWDYETCIRRPKMSRLEKLILISKAWLAAHLQRGRS